MTFDPHEVVRDQISVTWQYYKGKEATIRFRQDDGTFTVYGGTGKTDTDHTVNAVISAVANPKIWGPLAIMGESNFEAILWEGFDTEMLDQFFESNNFDNIRLIIDEVQYRIQKVMSPESMRSEIPYWFALLEKIQNVENA
jgi:hypothetical protein